MAVTVTAAELAAYIQDGEPEPVPAAPDYLEGWHAAAAVQVVAYAPAAPDVLHDRAVQMIVGYWAQSSDNPAVTRDHHIEYHDTWTDSKRSGNALRYSGAMALLSPYKRRRAR